MGPALRMDDPYQDRKLRCFEAELASLNFRIESQMLRIRQNIALLSGARTPETELQQLTDEVLGADNLLLELPEHGIDLFFSNNGKKCF